MKTTFSRFVFLMALASLTLSACEKKEDKKAEVSAVTGSADQMAVVNDAKWQMKPGKWEISGDTIVNGQKTVIPVMEECIQEDNRSLVKLVTAEHEGCKVEFKKVHDTQINGEVICEGSSKLEQDIVLKALSDTEYTVFIDQEISADGQDKVKTATNMLYKHVGACGS